MLEYNNTYIKKQIKKRFHTNQIIVLSFKTCMDIEEWQFLEQKTIKYNHNQIIFHS